MVRPSALAVLRLITGSNLVGCSIGRSAGCVAKNLAKWTGFYQRTSAKKVVVAQARSRPRAP